MTELTRPTVTEVQELLERAKVYELKPDMKYIIVVDEHVMSHAMARDLSRSLIDLQIPHVIVATLGGHGLRLFEVFK